MFIIIFHTILFTITSFRFGHFLESLAIVLLAFLSIPNKQLAITYRGNTVGYIKQLFQFFDLDKKQNWSKSTVKGDAWLSLKISDNVYLNHSALKKIIVYIMFQPTQNEEDMHIMISNRLFLRYQVV